MRRVRAPFRHRPRWWRITVLMGIAAVALLPVRATTVKQVDLAELCQLAHRIFQGRVVRVETGTVSAGGGELPFIEYTITVDHGLKGEFEEEKGVPVARIRMLGKPPPSSTKGVRRIGSFPGLPQLRHGQRYLLFTTRPGPTGLSTTVGLGQGCFEIHGEAGHETAVNEFGNRGLFRARTAPRVSPPGTGAVPRQQARPPSQTAADSLRPTAMTPGVESPAWTSSGRLPYTALATEIRRLLGEAVDTP